MMLYPTNSADRRQQPCTTTIRSRRAHPRHVLDTAALNAYVPNNVGSKSHNELTWNHVVSVFTFFGLLMTALVSLCCWSHFQFIVERRRLPANTEFNSQHRRLAPGNKVEVLTVSKNSNIIKALEAEPVYGEYTETEVVPEWFEKGDVEKYFKPKKGGTDCPSTSNSITWMPESSCPKCIKDKDYDAYKGKEVKVRRTECDNCFEHTGKLYGEPAIKDKTAAKIKEVTRDEAGWETITGGRPHYVKNLPLTKCTKCRGRGTYKNTSMMFRVPEVKCTKCNGDGIGHCIIFFCAIQKKWHMCGPDGIYYRVNGQDESLPKTGWFSQPGKTKGHAALDDECSIRVKDV